MARILLSEGTSVLGAGLAVRNSLFRPFGCDFGAVDGPYQPREGTVFLACSGVLLPREEENRYCGQLLARRGKPRISNRPGKFPGITMNPQR
ncbi:MAG TPA: hypothetical protein DCR72_02610 [Pseudomonas sp.]|nr:hypothetical protein CAQ69_02955 [Stutzerimonas stutzeri]HAR04465.1 hypothetical protein [Pseudomonas sp.]